MTPKEPAMSKIRCIAAASSALALILLLISSAAPLLAQGGGGLDNPFFSVHGGGGWSAGGSFALFSGLGQPDASNAATGGAFSLRGGSIFPPRYSNPTAVTLAGFDAYQEGDHIVVAWETLSEIDTMGFHLWRGSSAAGPSERLNTTIIPAQAPGSGQGFAYAWRDRSVQPATRYYYWLEDVAVSGAATRHGPVDAIVEVPVAVRLAELSAAAGPPGALPLLLAGASLALLAGGAVWRGRRAQP
jgi:hypothetical protein